MENFEFRKDGDGLWNKNINSEKLKDIKIDTDEKMRGVENTNNGLYRKRANVFSVIEKIDEKELETITELESIINMMKNDPTSDPKVLKKMQEELIEEKQKREILEPRVLEKEDEVRFALEKKKNLLN